MIARRYEEQPLGERFDHFMIRTSPTRTRFSRRHALSPGSSMIRTSARPVGKAVATFHRPIRESRISQDLSARPREASAIEK